MSPTLLFYPVFVQVMLTLTLLMAMGRARGAYLKASRMHPAKIGLGEDLWPPKVKQIGNSFHNQLELPVLFYAVVLFAIALNKADIVLLVLAWIFAISRIAHAMVHTGTNYVPRRAALFGAGVLCVVSMWVWLLVKTAT